MKLKLALLGLAALGFGLLGGRIVSHRRPRYGPQARAVVLLPATLDGMRVYRQWTHPLYGGAIERGAFYATAGGAHAIELDFFRNSPHTHNGIGCYIGHGEKLLWQRLQTVRFATAPAVVDLALLRTDTYLRLVAATECSAVGCSQQPLPFWRQFWHGLKTGLSRRAPAVVVPVAVVLKAAFDGSHGSAVTQATLLARFRRAAAQIDLAPARRLAALQSGFAHTATASGGPQLVTRQARGPPRSTLQ